MPKKSGNYFFFFFYKVGIPSGMHLLFIIFINTGSYIYYFLLGFGFGFVFESVSIHHLVISISPDLFPSYASDRITYYDNDVDLSE